jgi:uncharacterized protein (DUF433 family)
MPTLSKRAGVSISLARQDVLSGKPRIDGTRIPVALILGYLVAGSTPDEVIEEFPDLKREDIAACLDYARDLADYTVV